MNTRIGLILVYAAIQIPFSVFLIYGFVGGIPVELDEASILDGCNSVQLFSLVILPLLKPVIITVFILNFLNTWNEFVLPLYYMNDSRSWPMTLSIYSFFGRFSSDWHLVCADIVLMCIPVVAVYIIGQKYIISGMTAGAVKG
ncbi:MAG: carbohydrate ABC transporter permease [Acetivibrionales bacterium]